MLQTNVVRELLEAKAEAMDRPIRSNPSPAALRVAEELLDHVSYGLTRREQIHEIACVVDEAYFDLVRCAAQVVESASDHDSKCEAIAELRETLDAHLPEPRYHAIQTPQLPAGKRPSTGA